MVCEYMHVHIKCVRENLDLCEAHTQLAFAELLAFRC